MRCLWVEIFELTPALAENIRKCLPVVNTITYWLDALLRLGLLTELFWWLLVPISPFFSLNKQFTVFVHDKHFQHNLISRIKAGVPSAIRPCSKGHGQRLLTMIRGFVVVVVVVVVVSISDEEKSLITLFSLHWATFLCGFSIDIERPK